MKISNVLKYMISTIAHIVPRDNNLWLTGKITSWEYNNNPPMFFDNSKYFFLYLVNNTNQKVYWLSNSAEEIARLKEMGLPVVKFKSFKGLWLTLRAKYFFHHYGISQIDRILQYGSVQINLWHGTPLKKIAYDVVPKVNVKLNALASFLDKKGKTYCSSTSKFLSESILQHAFDLDETNMLNFGYPRNDIMKLKGNDLLEFCNLYASNLLSYMEICKGKKVYLYMPTFRDDDEEYFTKANIDFNRLDKLMEDNNSVFFLKLHPLTKDVDIDGYKNIIHMRNDIDIYPFLAVTDYLITDYSSIFFDFLMLDRDIIFIPYDYDNYVANRELYFDYYKFVPGIIFNSFDSFMNGIETIDKSDYSKKRQDVINQILPDNNFNACEQIFKYLRYGELL